MTITDILGTLRAIKLEPTEDCHALIERLIDDLMPIPWLHHPLRAKSIISRCRRDAPDLTSGSFGCKPAEMVDDYQRASISHETVFYASGCDEGKIEYADTIAMIETSKLHREGHEKGREKIAVSHWLVERDLNMALICHPKVQKDARPSDPLSDMQRNYLRLLSTYPEHDKIQEFDKLVEFIAGQFAKIVPEGENFQYLISAIFAHKLMEAADGIIYPSAQTDGHLGFNVALRPDVMASSLQFIDAQRCVLYKAGGYMPVPEGKYSDNKIEVFLGITDINDLPWIE